MDIRELHYFVQIVKDKSYTKAAGNLYISQPALSRMTHDLEKELGAKLICIGKNGISLTEYGELLYEKAIPLLNEFEALKNIVSDKNREAKGELRVGVTPMIGELYLVDIISGFYKRYPKIELKLIEGGSRFVREELIKENLDVGLCISGHKDDKIKDTGLFQDKMVVCINKNNPLSQKRGLSFAELSSEKFYFYANASTLYTQIINKCIKAGFEPEIIFTSSKVDLIMRLANKGNGICIVPRPYAERYKLPDLKLIPISDYFPWAGCLVENRKVYHPYIFNLFKKYVVTYFTNLCDDFE